MTLGFVATRVPVAIVALGLAAGCKTWRPATVSPERLIVERQPSTVRVTDSSGWVRTLDHPMLVGDSIVAPSAPVAGTAFVPPRDGVVTSEIRFIEVPEFSAQRTVALAAGIAVAGATWARLVAGTGGQPPPNEPEPKFTLSLWEGIQWVLGLRN